MKKRIVVIGAGIGGLAVSIELLQKGFEVTLIEKNSDVGGLCSGYDVNGFYIDGCLHWLLGSKKGTRLYSLWENIDAFNDSTKVVELPCFNVINYDNTIVRFSRDLEQSRKQWIEISKEDEKEINKFFNLVRVIGRAMSLALGDKENRKGTDIIKVLTKSIKIVSLMKYSREEYANNFTHPALRFAIKNAMTGYNNIFFFFDVYALFANNNANVPSGGAKYMIERIKNRFLSLGGKLLLNEEVISVDIQKEKVASVITNKGTYPCDKLISSVDPQYTLKEIFKNKYSIKKYERIRKKVDKNPISSCFNVYVTVKGDISYIDVPTCIKIDPIKVGSGLSNSILVRPYYFDKDYFVKDNKTVVSLFIDQNHKDYEYFKSLSKEEYQNETKRIIDEMIGAFINKYPELKGKVDYLTHFGPIELEKRSNSSYGALQAYSFTRKTGFYITSGKVSGLKNFYYCGQWARAIGGTPTALLTAHAIAKKIK